MQAALGPMWELCTWTAAPRWRQASEQPPQPGGFAACDFRKESQHVGSEVVTALLTHKRYSVSEAMVSVKYPRASSVLPGSL